MKKIFYTLSAIMLLMSPVVAQDSHHVSVLRIGGLNGTNGLSGQSTPTFSGAPVHIDRYIVDVASGAFSYAGSTDLPITELGTPGIYMSSKDLEGYLIQSLDRQKVSFFGYGEKSAYTGTAGYIFNVPNVGAVSKKNIARVPGIVRIADNSYDLSTRIDDYPIPIPTTGTLDAVATSALTVDGSKFWMTCVKANSDAGVALANSGATSATGVSGNNNYLRTTGVFGGDMYYTANAGTLRLGAVAIGSMPLTASTQSNLTFGAGAVGVNTYRPSQIIMFDLSLDVPGPDVMYVTSMESPGGSSSPTDPNTAGIYKYCKSIKDGKWYSYGGFGSFRAEGGYFGIAGTLYNGLPVLYVSRGVSSTPADVRNEVLQVKDLAGYEQIFNGVAGPPINANTQTTDGQTKLQGLFRGVSMYQANINLPVQMSALEATQNGATVTLTWETFVDDNIGYFEVERSTQNEEYQKIGTVASKGSSKYTFIDADMPSSEVLYRVKVVKKDGSVTYSKTVSVKNVAVANSNLSTIYPNPVKDVLGIAFKSSVENAVVTVYSVDGKPVKTYHQATMTNKVNLNVSDLQTGVYFVRVVQNDVVIAQNKFVKH